MYVCSFQDLSSLVRWYVGMVSIRFWNSLKNRNAIFCIVKKKKNEKNGGSGLRTLKFYVKMNHSFIFYVKLMNQD